MKVKTSGKPFVESGFFSLKNNEFLENQRIAGKVASNAIKLLKEYVTNQTQLSMIQLNNIIEHYIFDNSCIPTFKNYKGFPSGVCISINNQLVHGIPTDYILKEGDIVTFDLGTTYKGAIADTATTCEFVTNKYEKLINTTKECLNKAIASIEIGKQIGCIGNVIFKHAKQNGFEVVTQYGGHGIQENCPHSEPFISNKSNINEGIRFQKGMTIAIEPLLVIGYDNSTTVSNDKWTVYAKNICAHEEHTIFINDEIEIITEIK